MNLELLGTLVGWPLMMLAAWLAGEWLYRSWRLPRVSAYGVIGLVLGGAGLSQGVASPAALSFLANAALALMLFELGYRVNPRWVRHNPWVLIAGLVQAALTFAASMWVAGAFGLAMDQRLVLAALCVAISPAAVIRVTHELHSSGQVTERLLHLCALNCLIAALLLKLVVGYWHLENSGELGRAAFDSLYVIGLSLTVGAVFGFLAPILNRLTTSSQSTTVTFTILVLLLSGLALSLHLSGLLAALAFGAVARERRIMLSPAQRNFGGLGDLLAVFLFVFVGSLFSWSGMLASLLLGVALLGARTVVHVIVNASVARVSGTTLRKGVLTGFSLMPMSVFALVLLEESRLYGFNLAEQTLPMLAGMLVLLEVIAPLATQRALMWAREAHPPGEA